jgi:protein-tyrosine phosphatase
VRTELHFHLLPGVDDGPRDEPEAVELARLAVADGTARVTVTPHVRDVRLSELVARTDQLRATLREAGVPLEICRGGELSPDDVPSLGQNELELLAHGPAGRRWVLMEAPLWSTEPSLPVSAAELRARGFGVLIAHPERSGEVTAAELREEVRMGAVLQLNASSLVGIHGEEAERAAVELARSGIPFVLSSDAHSSARPPLLRRGRGVLASAGVDPATVTAAVEVAPARLLSDGLGHRVGDAPARAG